MNACQVIKHDDQTLLAFHCRPCRLAGIDRVADFRTPSSVPAGDGFMLCAECCEREYGPLPRGPASVRQELVDWKA